ncbi:uncharacterized protein LOC129615327 [Condylostylus longicornis]|uniref:uncharacterized protein LOC129615327 n=1 Tax=Condylostylus longicornis TaxID=2530218 RepID=UPI00244DBE5F|nr:uncharacterized protein LOC129615327 [Condylostylus longicornis]
MTKLIIFSILLIININKVFCIPCCGEIIDEFDLKKNEMKSFFYNQTEQENCFRFSVKRLTDYDLNDDISFLLAEDVKKPENFIIITLMNKMANMKKQTATGHCFLTESRNKDIIFNDWEFVSFWLQSSNGELTLRHELGPNEYSEPFLKFNRDIGFKVNNFVVTHDYSSKGYWQIKMADCSQLPK